MNILNKIVEYVGTAQIASAAVTPLTVDGVAGKTTIKMLQGYFGCAKTGTLTGQKESYMKKYAPNVTAYSTSKKVSPVVMKLQAWCEFDPAFINGIWDVNLSYALQYHLNLFGYDAGKCDGIFAKKSVKALQRFLNDQIPKPVPPAPSTLGDAIIQACKDQAAWMKNAKYGKYSPVTIAHSKTWGTCVTYEGCVLQRLGYKKKGGYVWHNGKGYGTGKVTGANSKMVVAYMNNKKLSSLKAVIQKGDMLLFDDNKSGRKGDGGHVCFATGEWSGNDALVWDVGTQMICERKGKPRPYSGAHKVLAIVRLKG